MKLPKTIEGISTLVIAISGICAATAMVIGFMFEVQALGQTLHSDRC